MAYIKRISDDRVFEVFGAETHQSLKGRDIVGMLYFFIYDSEATEDDDGNLCDGLWCWRPCTNYLPLEELVPEEEYEVEMDDEHDPLPPKEDRL